MNTELSELNPISDGIEDRLGRSPDAIPRILILGGTGEAAELAAQLASRNDLEFISSFAGRVSCPKYPIGVVRVGGFGGIEGLISYLIMESISVVVDATHPFAVGISRNTEAACARLGLPLVALVRPTWQKQKDDLWHEVITYVDAAEFVNKKRGRVFLSIGRQEVGSFAACNDAWFLIRAIEAPTGQLPQHHEILLQRGPFDLKGELQLLRDYSIDHIVSKNSGGSGTYTKIEAARLLQIPVVMVERPTKHTVPTVDTVGEVVTELAELLTRPVQDEKQWKDVK
ncbi:cobalt-precorrin-6A reductase [Tunturibacter psychrotolerans]|uniref:Cobalt-precorrin-6A reductase n=1 Tax=Tunturiibacter psychrotolerans TaxID=3069686 RepID=A0AAU7ZU80_9BACT